MLFSCFFGWLVVFFCLKNCFLDDQPKDTPFLTVVDRKYLWK